MCGRYTLASDLDALVEELELDEAPAALAPRFNVAPTQEVVVVTSEAPRRLERARWGLVPSWARDTKGAARAINARIETLATRSTFRVPFRERRCLVPADGFYEWRREAGRKVPVHIRRRDRRPFTFAGLWDVWKTPDGAWLRSCAIVTAPAVGAVAQVHDRMPVILGRARRAAWLDRALRDPDRLAAALGGDGDRRELLEAFEIVQVSPAVGSPANDSPALVEPVESRPDDGPLFR